MQKEIYESKCKGEKMNNIIEKWSQQVKLNTQKVSVCYCDKCFSYTQMDVLSDCCAYQIYNKKVNKDNKTIGVMMKSSELYIISLLAILKCGYTFVPIDEGYPEERIKYIINECGIDLLLVDNNEVFEYVTTLNITTNLLDNKNNKGLINTNNEVAYIIYTSGTTGNPKGIQVGHEGVLNLIKWFDEEYNISLNCNIIQMANIMFDVSIIEIFGCILNGGTLYIPTSNDRLHYRKLREFIIKNKINIIQTVPVMIKELLLDKPYIESLNIVISGGEALGESLKDKLIGMGYCIHNHYGLTETTVDCLFDKCERGKMVVLGKPISNCKCYIVDNEHKIMKQGDIGELCCVGRNLSIGYLNNEEMNKKKFIEIDGERAFLTGDLCYLNKEGDFVYCGRSDNQVKVKGKRIELEEIENCITKIKEIDLCRTIIVKDNYGGKIVSFYSSRDELDKENINEFVSKYLPDYMIPRDYVYVDEFVRNKNGKIDTKHLLDRYISNKLNLFDGKVISINAGDFDDDISRRVINIISEVLEISSENLNRGSKVDDLGMDSLGFMGMIVGIEESFDIEVEDETLTLQAFDRISDIIDYVKNRTIDG